MESRRAVLPQGAVLHSRSILEPEVPPQAIDACSVSLGICTVRALTWPDLRTGPSASDREEPLFKRANGTLTARPSCALRGCSLIVSKCRRCCFRHALLLAGW